MFVFLHRNKKEMREYVALFDIGSASVAGALVVLDGDTQPHITYTTRVPLTLTEVLDAKTLEKKTAETVRVVSERLIKALADEQVNQFSRIVCMSASPWVHIETASIEAKHDEPKDITDAYIKTLLESARAEIVEKAAETAAGVDQTEEFSMQVLLNGYPTANPEKKKAKHIALSLAVGYMDTAFHSSLERVFDEQFGETAVSYNSFILPFFLTARDVFEQSDFLLMDVTGEVSDIGVVRGDILSNYVTFPYGKHSIARDLAELLGTTPEESLSRLSLGVSGTQKEDSTVQKSIETVAQKWIKQFGSSVGKLSETKRLPNFLLLACDGSIGLWLAELTSRIDFGAFTLTGEAFSPELLTANRICEFCTFKGKSVKEDPFLAVGALFAKRIRAVEKNKPVV
ncbi:hypothetical protein COU17_00275 [Candidatus Kaiserbacteria bacterium CG10_big_fil_rev_8_21_14_0_10_49_17]|uniref:SHS2 domain-containing protein n=1 Tax=Candidatus Kaiserbacteria bacterium CG10_big_fil_rev_8_21_14_0_10_49_17 TaxID=1974609 RepID=A0A2M6WF60_9BACT|nr:MAG: hypothetical protein COU17_00275 [Candidatus Kaiserbacteria bacterium CG10_big_fil_rev_8_21_14_0_10_49_17]